VPGLPGTINYQLPRRFVNHDEANSSDQQEETTPMHDYFTVRETDDGECYVHVSRLGRSGCESDRFRTRREALDWVAAEFPKIPEKQS